MRSFSQLSGSSTAGGDMSRISAPRFDCQHNDPFSEVCWISRDPTTDVSYWLYVLYTYWVARPVSAVAKILYIYIDHSLL